MDNIVENPVNNTVEDFLSFLQKEPSIDKKEIEKKNLIVEKTETMVKECEKCTKLKNEIGKLENTCVVTGEKCAMDFVSGGPWGVTHKCRGCGKTTYGSSHGGRRKRKTKKRRKSLRKKITKKKTRRKHKTKLRRKTKRRRRK